MQTTTKTQTKTKPLLSGGHRACAGCGQLMAAKTVIETLGPNTIIANATGCLEVTTTPFPQSAWGVPWIHSLFENNSSVASGVFAALKKKGKADDIKILAQGGDGGTFDIGMGQLSGMWERGDEVIYVCYDNEAYANTGVQASGATPYGASTTTTPANKHDLLAHFGSNLRKKDMLAIAIAHRVPFVAQTTTGYITDIVAKIKKAMATPGPSYIQILSPCVPGWNIDPSQTVAIGRLAAQTGLYPVLEYANGQLTNAMKIPNPAPKVEEYLKIQGRFNHLFADKTGQAAIKAIQSIADENIAKYGLK